MNEAIKIAEVENRIHVLKIAEEFFKALLTGDKKHELRKNDRNYKVEDFLIFPDLDEDEVWEVTHITKDYEGLLDGYVLLSLKHLSHAQKSGAKTC